MLWAGLALIFVALSVGAYIVLERRYCDWMAGEE